MASFFLILFFSVGTFHLDMNLNSACLFAPLFLGSALSLSQPARPAEYEILVQQFSSLKADENQVATVRNMTFRRDAAIFVLQEGKLYLATPMGSRVYVALFAGKGTFSFSPPLPVEQELLVRFAEKRALHEEISSAVFVFGDSSAVEWQRSLTFVPEKVDSRIQKEIAQGVNYLCDKKRPFLFYEFAKTFLEQDYNDLFAAQLTTESLGNLLYEIDPFAEEQVRLYERRSESVVRSEDYFRLICQFPRGPESMTSPAERAEIRHGYRVVRNTLDCTITSPSGFLGEYFGFQSSASIQLRAVDKPRRWIMFSIHPKLRVDSVRSSDGTPARFFQAKDSREVWIECDPPLSAEKVSNVTIMYHGDILRKADARVLLESSAFWYPRQDSWGRQMFDATFRYPSEYTLVAVGDLESQSTDNDVITTRWTTSTPVRGFSFNIGKFKQRLLQDPATPFINVLFTGAADSWLSDEVADDMLNAIRLFQKLFGPPPVHTLHATETPYFHGEAFPGLIHFSHATFLRDYISEAGTPIFRAHEVAHQWWGIGVDVRSYHDVWLGEAFAQYSGMLYMQAVQNDNERFFEELRTYRKRILATDRTDRTPISLGHRTSNYFVRTYQHGAWVLHMLRMMFLDLKTMNEDIFNSILSTFYTRYRNKIATTDDFRRVVEEKSGMEMSWFFRQWIERADVPKYRFSYNVEPTLEKKFKVRCRVVQTEVPSDFRMYVPIRINFDDERFARVRVLIQGPVSEFELPPLPLWPEEVILNDMESVLCEVDTERWKQ